MSKPDLKQNNQLETHTLQDTLPPSNPKGTYEQLMEEGKQVLDSIHLATYNQPNFPIHRPIDPTPALFTQTLRLSNRPEKYQHPSEEEAKEPPIEDDSRRQANQNLQQISKKSSKIFGCNCLKSKCTKNYCQCFTQARKCNELCKCTGCQNQGEVEKRYRSILQADEGQKFCNCKKSNCLKKYCECYNSGVKCNSSCKCEQCKNGEEVGNGEMQDVKEEIKREKSQKEIEEINLKIEELAKMVPKEHQQYLLSFLDYLLS